MPERNADYAYVDAPSIYHFLSDEAWHGRLPAYNEKGDRLSPMPTHIKCADAIANAGYALVKVGEVPPWMERWGGWRSWRDSEGRPTGEHTFNDAYTDQTPLYRRARTGRNADA